MGSELQRRVAELVTAGKRRETESPVEWAVEVRKWVEAAPSIELGEVLVSQLCFQHNRPSLWKFLDIALSSGLLYPLHIISMLSSRVIPHRWSQPEAYRLYLELLRRYAFSCGPLSGDVSKEKITESIDVALELSQTYKVRVVELGHAFVLFFFSVISSLIDSTLDDWGFKMTSRKRPRSDFGGADYRNMEIDSRESQNLKVKEHRERIRKMNSFLAIEVLAKLTASRKALVLLRLVHLNMPEIFNGLLQRLRFLEGHHRVASDLRSAVEPLARLSANIQRVSGFKYQLNKHQFVGVLLDNGSQKPVFHCNSGFGHSTCWVRFDIYMENAMDGKQLSIKSVIDILAEGITTLQVFNQASWQETFLALWLSALRLVQRERDPLEGPVPHLESRLCILLCIVPLAIANILKDETKMNSSPIQGDTVSGNTENGYEHKMGGKANMSKKQGLISSLQALGNFSGLLCPPSSVVDSANIAATKSARFVRNSKNEKDTTGGSGGHVCIKAGGDMRHLIVEACIARNLIDTSAYFWPGYMSASTMSLSNTTPIQKSPWSTFMEGEPLRDSLINSLITTPASSLEEIKKLYHIALNGSDEEKSAAAKILCGASLRSGWNIQEHVVHFVVKLLSPPVPPNHTGPRSHLIDYMSMLSALLFGASYIDTVHILSLHGKVPEVAASLIPLCEVFGSHKPASNKKSSMGDESSIYMVFSLAFLFLFRLWKFYRPPLEQYITDRGGPVGGVLTLEYLLLLRNGQFAPSGNETNGSGDQLESSSVEAMCIDSYPKLQAWYRQHKSCTASTLSSLSSGNPVHEVANKILSMIYWKITRSGAPSSNSSGPSSASISGSPADTREDACQRPVLPAWEVLEAIPFVLEAMLTACAHGRLSSRDLTTGLRDLVEFLPASLAAIISYFSAEVTHGIWKPVPMNGIDWPSPAAVLQTVESEINEILNAVGVNVPSCASEISTATLPLPMAALVSLTITFKLEKSVEYIYAVAGLALENCALSCDWPSMPILGCLWAQKVRRWHNFIVVSTSRAIFGQNKDALAQLLRSCFSSFLGTFHVSTSSLSGQSGVNGLLGLTIADINARPFVAPGFLYLSSCRTIHVVQHVSGVIVGLVAEYAMKLATRCASTDSPRLNSSQVSQSLAIVKIKEVASLGASLLCVAGGVQLVQELYRETIPNWLLSSKEERLGEANAVSRVMEGYAMAYLVILSGSIEWGIGDNLPSWAHSRRARVVGIHMDFLAGSLEGNRSLGCHPATWKAYVSCLVGLMVNFAPMWIREVKVETLRKLAGALRGWHESELAISLLERGGASAIGSAAELVVNVLD
ncbi:mediator of RNA polymerase II transcription subunit 33A-like isoform X1 [Malus sylvestris]|uniref:mediator of RNA polymerase II transcription subunit 33A-like isoform X1 n=1 Tax=Malus sylvestris TaxID=3752 RepID=UPI0021ACB7E4|nr:mediator of RNA polymerase II transcription subunit 33A-like isoform X1 [Malus sylvestris]XP_050141952.1 mediator of RNA polymerase II transcription subunit 33A-like isoform X1 [Malus sylvestris]